MNPFRTVVAVVSGGVGLVIAGVVIFFLWRLKGDFADFKKAKDTADVVRLTAKVTDLEGRLAQKDSIAAQQAATFLTARDRFTRQPVVTGGGAKADAIANSAVQACFDQGVKALTACQAARATADTVPILRDSIFTLEKRLIAGQRKRWTARGSGFYTWPEKAPLARIETDLRITNSLSLTAGGEKVFISRAKLDSATRNALDRSPVQTWRYYIGGSIPFR